MTGIVTQRAKMIEPKAAGTKETIKLQYGPYEIAPGGDANQVGAEFAGANGYIVSAKPRMRFADGATIGHDDKVHLHHAHLFRADRSGDNGASSGRTGAQWVFGTGGEQTEGSFEKLSRNDPSGKSYGLPMFSGDPMMMVWMPMNMSDENKVAYLEFEFEFVHGTPEAVKSARGKEITPLRPILLVVDVRAVRVLQPHAGALLELLEGADDRHVALLAAPDRQRRAPVALARERPVDVVLQPAPEAPVLDVLGMPRDLLVGGEQLVVQLRRREVPRRLGVVEQRRPAAPAVRVGVLVGLGAQQAAAAAQVLDEVERRRP